MKLPFAATFLAIALVAWNCAGAEAGRPVPIEEPEAPLKYRAGVSFSLGFNASANFSRLSPVLLPPPPPDIPRLDRRYDDGFVLRDSYGDGANTIYWGYFDNTANQNINSANSRLTLHKASLDEPASVRGVGEEPRPGIEVTLSREVGELWRGKWGFEGGFGFLKLTIRDNRSITLDGTLTSDQYDLTDSAAEYFNGNYPNNYQGVFGPAINVPFIPDVPIMGTRTVTPVSLFLDGEREFEASLYFWRLGGYWERQLYKRLYLVLNGGLVLAWIHSDFSFQETTTLPYGEPITESGSGSKTGWQVGGYVGANLRYELSRRWGISAGGRFEKVGDYHQSEGGKQAEFVLGKSLFFTFGVQYSF